MTPDVRVVRGRPDDLELAALVAGLAAGAVAGDPYPADGEGVAEHGLTPAARRRWRYAGSPLAAGAGDGEDQWRWSLRT